ILLSSYPRIHFNFIRCFSDRPVGPSLFGLAQPSGRRISALQRLSAWPKPPTDPPAMPSFQIRLVHARTESPDAERQLPRLDPHPLRLAVPGPAMAIHQVFTLSLRIIRQAQFP